jgi:hypothetical protein
LQRELAGSSRTSSDDLVDEYGEYVDDDDEDGEDDDHHHNGGSPPSGRR